MAGCVHALTGALLQASGVPAGAVAMGEREEPPQDPCSGGKEQGRWGTSTPTPLLPSDPVSGGPWHCGSPGAQSEEGSAPVPAGAEPGGEGQGGEWVWGQVTSLVACIRVLCPLHHWTNTQRPHGAGFSGKCMGQESSALTPHARVACLCTCPSPGVRSRAHGG